jgi:GPH family glycoside/pentoside/hexuronide:cation symporter
MAQALPSRRSGRPAPVARGPERVPLATVLAYGPPIFALSGLLFFVQFYFLKFATDVLLLPPAGIALIFALGRLWDAVSDPLAGTWSDRTRSRLGRRRPWMLAALAPLAVAFVMIWAPPAALSGTGLTVWAALALFAFFTAFTVYIIPHQSLGAELTRDHHDRSRVFGVRHAFFTIGMMCAFGGMQYVNNAEDPRRAALLLSLAGAAVASLVLLVPPAFVRERSEYQGRGGARPFRAMRDVLSNPHARVLLFVQFIEMTGAGVLGILSPYLVVYVLKEPELIGPLPAIFVVCSVLSIPFWVRTSRRFGKRNVWIVAMVGFALSFGATFFVGEGDVALISVLLVFAGLSAGCGGAVGPSILADVIDYDEYRSGERKEGAYSAAWGFAIKSAQALIVLLTGIVLDSAGFVPNAEQTETAKLAIRGLYAGAPLVLFLLGAALFSRFGLDHREHARIQAELERRRAAAG